MIGLSLSINGSELVLSKLESIELSISEIGDPIGAMLVSQTQHRIQSEKSAPDGTPWKAWSSRYARTRKAQHSLLVNEGHLQLSIQAETRDDGVHWGSPMIYAARNHKLRPFIGISSSNKSELLELVNDYLARRITA